MSITKEEFEEKVSELFIHYLEKCTPEEIHQVVVEWNFDNPKKPIHWIANSPKTDKGTALMLFWLMEPDFAYQFETREEMVEKSSWYQEDFDIVTILEEKYLAGFYQNQVYGYAPPTEFQEEEMKRAIASEMFLPLKGLKVSEAADWADGFPPALQERYNELAESVEE
ncbi:DUF4274 domain-containing protein [Listeria monocytogenes]|nr:DUF4274 domain-containing protein [Listeria monocytogenes]EEP7692025.1 DUF4274 domain-containing protein [Listeria monocytogenes]EEP7716036.1 DUF4274 domain-containing protein [Listeria monocytogenes]EEP7721889.1 DUF4274 domain-containing protein [Listeria monocytogenes]EEP9223908.1 DUF4274 domain-containing protein [Listeria monocytogenes]